MILIWFKGYWGETYQGENSDFRGPEAVMANYGADIVKYSKEFDLPANFFAALCMLESEGRKPVPARFEKHVYSKLKLVQIGLKNNYEHVKAENIMNANDEALQNLASSWGPFQLMGYKCLLYDIKIKDLRGDDCVYWAIKWINETYGTYLKRKDYKSAFHIHNAGSPFPKNGKSKTYNPNYVNEGLQWMEYFKDKL